MVGVSGGTDSSYMLAGKEEGLRPLAVHYDNTWNTSTATQYPQGGRLGVDLYTHGRQQEPMISSAPFLAGVAEIEAATDLALQKLFIGRLEARHKICWRDIPSSRKELLQWANYFDGKYIKSIHQRYGTLPMRTYPLMSFRGLCGGLVWQESKR